MVSLYRRSLRTAKDEGDLDRWRASLNENIRCRDFIDKIISEKYDGRYVPAESWEETVKEFGYGYKPTNSDFDAIAQTADDYLEMFTEPQMGENMGMGM